MKYIRGALVACSIIFTYVLPIILFGYVIPYTHGTLSAGLTGAGYVMLAIVAIIIFSKIKKKVHTLPKTIFKGILLALFSISTWVLLGIGIDFVRMFVATLLNYWWKAFIFIIIGQFFTLLDHILFAKTQNEVAK